MRIRDFLLVLALILGVAVELKAQKLTDYKAYHQEIMQAEELMARHRYPEALAQLEHTINSYDYIFLRDYKVATQLAIYLEDRQKAFGLLRGSIAAGFTLKEMRKTPWLAPLREAKSDWQPWQAHYTALRHDYEQRLNQPLRAEVREMARQDQQLALVNLLKLGKRARARFLSKNSGLIVSASWPD